jgi:hypothetical protein
LINFKGTILTPRDEVVKLVDAAESGKEVEDDGVKGILVVKVFENDDIQPSDSVCDKDGEPVKKEEGAGEEPAAEGDEEEKKTEGEEAGAEGDEATPEDEVKEGETNGCACNTGRVLSHQSF